MPDYLRSLALPEAEVRTLVASLDDEWTVESVEAVRGSANSLYAVDVRVEGERRPLVCKCCQGTDAPAFRPEPYLLDAVGRRTSVPVPGVERIADHHDRLDGPLFLMERRDGEALDDPERTLSLDARGRVAYQAGRNLGELHALGSFDRFGLLRLRSDVEHDGGGIEVGDRTITVEDDARDEWRDWLWDLAEFYLGNLHERFADLEERLRDALDEGFDRLGGERPVLAHNDYQFWNLLVDPETGETRAVLDFENKWTAAPEHNVAETVDGLCSFAPLDSRRRERVRRRFYEGYEATNALARDEGFERRRDCYRLAARLPSLVYFESHATGLDRSRRDDLADRHREFATTLAERIAGR